MTDKLDDKNLREIFIDLQVYGNPLYENQVFRLRFRVSPMYPLEVPWVQFVNPGNLQEDVNEVIKARRDQIKQAQVQKTKLQKKAMQEKARLSGISLSQTTTVSKGLSFRSLLRSKPSKDKVPAPVTAPAASTPESAPTPAPTPAPESSSALAQGPVLPPGASPRSNVSTSFAVDGIPVHPHIYGNGHICLDLLGAGWSPVHTLTTIALSLQSMLAGNDKYGEYNLIKYTIELFSIQQTAEKASSRNDFF